MSLQLYVGHNGQSLPIDTSRVSSIEALRTWVSQSASIQPNNQVFLTSKGKAVRPQSLLTESEFFVFDSSLLSGDLKRAHTAFVDPPELVDSSTPPDTLTNQTDLQSWQQLFRSRLDWAIELRNQCAVLAKSAQRCTEQQAVIQRSLSIAIASLQIHTRGAEQKQQAAETWADELVRDQERRIGGWEDDLNLLARIPGKMEFARFVQVATSTTASQGESSTLQSFIDVVQVRSSAAAAKKAMSTLSKRVVNVRNMLEDAGRQSEELVLAVEQIQSRSTTADMVEPRRLMDEVEIILRKISSDNDHVSSLPRTAQSVSQASKMALLHTRNYLPNLREFAAEMNDLVQRAVEHRNHTADNSLQHMQILAKIESQLSRAYAEIKKLDLPQDEQQAFDILNVVSRLPHAYGSLMIEAVRRREWIDKMKKDSSTLAEEMATYQEEEEKRRKKWLNSIDDVIRPEVMKNKTLGIEVNLQADGDNWPQVSRQELQNYLQILSELGLPQAIIEDLTNAFRTLDQPTRKQIKHAKAFKNGSIHEAAFGTTSLMLRGEDEYRVLQEANSKLEDEVRGQKSRVRKLEDLLHRQTSMSRIASVDVFTPHMELVSAPDHPVLRHNNFSDEFQKHNTNRSRRTSSNVLGEEKRLAQRIVALEADLQAAQDRNATLEREVKFKHEAHETGRQQMEEAISTKKDIMENMEAQQREFVLERKTLEQELANARGKLEELEDEFDRLIGSRDNERSGLDARTRVMEDEMAKVKVAHDKELSETKEDLKEARERYHELEERLGDLLKARKAAEAKIVTFQGDLDERRQAEDEQRDLLMTVHSHLAPGTQPPGTMLALSSALEELSRKAAGHMRDLSEALALAKSEHTALRTQNQTLSTEVENVKKARDDLQSKLSHVQEKAEAEAAKAESLSGQLEDEKDQLRRLRSKIADGEIGADTLRQRVEEEETKVGHLSEQLAEARSHVNAMDVETERLKSRLRDAEVAVSTSSDRLSKRSERSTEISQRLYSQNTRLLRLLEMLGFAVTHRDSQMVIERASKVGASTFLLESQNPTVSFASPPSTRKPSDTDDPSILSSLHWSDRPTVSEEASSYHTFMSQISLFSTDIFAEAIAKRIRDFEYTARKWQKEAKLAASKSHRHFTDAASKIAVREFKEGDLALFLPTKGKAVGAWAAFNINAPHHFLRERDGMSLSRREWLVARITRVEERVVDLSKSMTVNSTSASFDDESENPFDLSDGLTWYLVHATEEKGGAPTTPGLGKSTVSASVVDAKGSIGRKTTVPGSVTKTLGRSLDSRRSSVASRASANTKAPSIRQEDGAEASTSKLKQPSKPLKPDQSEGNKDRDRERSTLRSQSPSKSIRSLARHLDHERESSTKQRGRSGERDREREDESGGGGWKSLWSLDLEIESPRKNGGGKSK